MRVTRIAGTRETRKKRVAAYCRVSTLKDEQEESFETQERYYRAFIQRNPDWIFAGVYGDPGCSAVTADHRPQFQKMMADALDGRIDLILCKSISRFSRNVVDCRRYTDRLKERNVYVRFEKENVTTSDPTAEFVFNLLSAVAQGESRSLSENIRWAHQERIKRGIYNLGSNRVLGYDTVDGKLTPSADAWIVREIFQRFVAGEGYQEIIRDITEMGAKPLRGEAFHIETLRRIVRDETYVGDKLLQKDAPTGFFTKRPDKSLHYDSYYLKDEHEGVISRALWDKAREMIAKQERETKTGIHRKGKDHHVLYGRVFCGECGAPFIRRTFRKGKKDGVPVTYRAWCCREKKGGKGCGNHSIQEAALEAEITSMLGWEGFDARRFMNTVDKVTICVDRIVIETRDGSDV